MQDSRCAVRDFLVKHTKEEILKHKAETVDVFYLSWLDLKRYKLVFNKIKSEQRTSKEPSGGREKNWFFLMTLRLKQRWLYFWFKLLNLLSKVFPSIQEQLSLFGITLWILSLLLLKLCWVQQKTLVCFKHVWVNEKAFSYSSWQMTCKDILLRTSDISCPQTAALMDADLCELLKLYIQLELSFFLWIITVALLKVTKTNVSLARFALGRLFS